MNPWDTMNIAPLMLIESAEPVYADRAVDALRVRLRSAYPEADFIKIEHSAYEAGTLAQAVSPSLFSQQHILIIRHCEQANAQLLKDLLAYIEHPAPDTVVIICHGGGMRAKKVVTALKKAGAEHISIKKITRASDKAKAVHNDVREAGRKMTDKAVYALIDALGSDMRELLAGLRQLLSDVSGVIEEADVHTYFSGRVEATVFNVADAAVAGHSAQAIQYMRHALATGVSPVAIVAAMANNIRTIVAVRAQRERKHAIFYQRVSVNIPSWKRARIQASSSAWSDAGLAQALMALAQADEGVKGGSRDPAYAVEKAIIMISRARRMR